MTPQLDHAFGRRPPADRRLTRTLLPSTAARRGLLVYVGAVVAVLVVAGGDIAQGMEDAFASGQQADLVVALLTAGVIALAVLNCFVSLLILGCLYMLALRVGGLGARLPHGTDAVARALWPLSAALFVAAGVGIAVGAEAMFESSLLSVLMGFAVAAHLVLLARRARELSGRDEWWRAVIVVAAYVVAPALLLLLAQARSVSAG